MSNQTTIGVRKVKIHTVSGGYRIFCYNTNRYYSRIARDNAYVPITFQSYEEVEKVCKDNNYEITNPMK